MNIVSIRRGLPGGFRYFACDLDGTPIKGFDKLRDIRKQYAYAIRCGEIQLKRDLDKHPDVSKSKEILRMLEKILRSM